MGKVHLIVNPVSGRGVLRSKMWQVLEMLSAAGYQTTVSFTQKRGDATSLAALPCNDYDFLICAGGDGTLNEVISGVMKNPLKPAIGYIPVGSTNDFATSLGLSKTVPNAVKDIICGKKFSIDIGDFNGRYFSYIASFGAFTEASYNAPQEVKNVIGHAAYILEGIKSLGNIRPYRMKFTFNDKIIEDDFIFGAVSNTTSVGGILKLDENMVKLNDGEFEVLLIKNPANLNELQQIIGTLISKSFDNDNILFYHTKEITVQTKEKVDWTLDGEMQKGSNTVTINNIPGAISLILPDKK